MTKRLNNSTPTVFRLTTLILLALCGLVWGGLGIPSRAVAGEQPDAGGPGFVGDGENQDFDLLAAGQFATVTTEEVDAALDVWLAARKEGGRLFYTPERVALAREKIADDPVWGAYYAAMERGADAFLNAAPLERVLEGHRLLAVSREALRRIFTLTFCAQIHPEKSEYAERALAEMRTIARFSDWNPYHFLDVGEMTAAMAIGYDALRSEMSEEDDNLIAEAIVNKGLRASDNKRYLWWVENNANWNQVCHAGLTLGALAVADRQTDLARKIIRRAVNAVTCSMVSYEPDGNYTEGAMYWSYGTSFNILLLTALKDTLGTDFGRSDASGFSRSINYYEQVFGPTQMAWNYSDSTESAFFEPTAFFFVEKFSDKDLTYNEYRLLVRAFYDNPPEKRIAAFSSFAGVRLAPMAFLFDTGKIHNPPLPPKANGYTGVGNGKSPIAVFRTGWDPNAAWFGIKGGTASAPHGHMDAGSFIYERYGVRWAVDLGKEDYHKIESRGMGLWGSEQESDRWKLYRYSNISHNIPTVNGELFLAEANAPILETSIGAPGEDSRAVVDLTPVYAGSLRSARREGTLRGDGTLEIVDTLTAPAERSASVTWRMLTRAEPEIVTGRTEATSAVRLSMGREGQEDKKASIELTAHLEGADQPVQWNWSDAKSGNDWDSPNNGVTDLNFTFEIPAGATVTVRVDLR